MACVILSSGRSIPENTPYTTQAGEVIVGVDWTCGTITGSSVMHFRKCSNCGELGIYEST